MSINLWKSNSGHFQWHIWKLAAALYEVTLARNRIGAGSGLGTSVSACVKAPNLLLIGHVKTFISSMIFNVSCIDWTLSFFFLIFLLGIFLIYISNAIPKVPHTLPSTPLPTHSHFLALEFPCTGAYKVCKSNGPLFAVMAD